MLLQVWIGWHRRPQSIKKTKALRRRIDQLRIQDEGHMTLLDLILRNAAGLIRLRGHQLRSTGLQLPGTPRSTFYQAVLIVQSIDRRHSKSPYRKLYPNR